MSAWCSICLDEARTQLAALNCGHVFHEKCLGDWLTTSCSCPKCRLVVRRSTDFIKLFTDVDLRKPAIDDFDTTDRDRIEFLCTELTRSKVAQCQSKQQLKSVTIELTKTKKKLTKAVNDLKKKTLKCETDMVLKNKLRAKNKELRTAVKEMKTELDVKRRDAPSGIENTKKRRNSLNRLLSEAKDFCAGIDYTLDEPGNPQRKLRSTIDRNKILHSTPKLP